MRLHTPFFEKIYNAAREEVHQRWLATKAWRLEGHPGEMTDEWVELFKCQGFSAADLKLAKQYKLGRLGQQAEKLTMELEAFPGLRPAALVIESATAAIADAILKMEE